MDYKEFSTKIKAKYPVYADMQDEELSKKMIEKFPQYKDQVELPGFFSKVGEDLSKRGEQLGKIYEDTKMGKINPLSTGLQTVGTLFGGAGDIVGQGLSAVTPDIVKEKAGAAVTDVLQTDLGKKGIEFAKRGIDGWNAFKEVYPEIAGDLEASVNIASLFPLTRGAQIARKAVAPALKEGKVLAKTLLTEGKQGIKSNIAKKAEEKLVEYVMPTLGADEAAKAAALGEKGIKDATLFKPSKIIPQEADKAVAQAVTGVVDQKKTLSSNITKIKNYIADVSEKEIRPFLRASKAIYNENELKGALSKLIKEIPEGYDDVQKNIYQKVTNLMLTSAKQQAKKTTEGLWDARIAFDNLLEKNFGGGILDTGGKITAKKEAALAVRRVVNDIVGSKSDDELFKAYMKRVHRTYIALENLKEKQANSVLGKIVKTGKSKTGQFLQKHPAVKYGASLAVPFGLGAAGVKLLD